jgi:hypothetical protein
MLIAEDPFSVQIKSESVDNVQYTDEEASWFIQLEVPLFFAKIDASNGKLSFYTSSRYRQELFYVQAPSRIELDFTSDESSRTADSIRAGMAPPILECTEQDSRTDQFAEAAYQHFKKWIAFEKESIRLQQFNIHVSAKWEHSGEPQLYFTGDHTTIDQRHRDMAAALPIVDKLAFHAHGIPNHDPTLLEAFVRVLDWYKDEGFDESDLNVNVHRSQMEEWRRWQNQT